MFEKQDRGPGLNSRQKMVVVAMDLLFLAELAYSIYAGQQDPEHVTGIFLRAFIPMALSTLIAARILLKKLRTEEPTRDGTAEGAESRASL
jgi:hypothetical protein